MKSGSSRRMPGPPNVTTVCGTSSGTNARCGGLAASTSAIADHGDAQAILRNHAADVILHVGDVDLRHAVERAVALPAIGMIAERDFEELAARQRGRVGAVAAQPRKHLCANALDVGGVEMRRGQRQMQEVESLVLVVLEHAERAAERV